MVNYIGGRSAFSRKFGFPKTNVRVWHDGKHRPSLEALLKICYYSGLQLSELLCGEYEGFNVRPDLCNKEKPYRKSARKAFTQEDVEKILLTFLNEQASVSMSEAARLLGCNKRILYSHFPELCKAISKKHIHYIQKCHDQRINEACIRVKEATIQLYKQGLYPSRRRVEDLLQTEIIREKSLQRAWQDTLMSLDLRIR